MPDYDIDDNEILEVNPAPEFDEVEPAPVSKTKKTAADFFRPIRISADVVKQTVGVDTDHITPDLLLNAAKKVLWVARNEDSADDRDSLEFQRVYGSSEYLPEHIQRDGGRVARNLLWKATNRGNLDFIGAGALEPHVDSVFNDSKLAQYIDGANMFESIDNNTKITRIGEGGIGDQRMAPDEMRNVQNSFLGFIDSLRFPESLRIGLDSYLSKNTRKGSDGKLYTRMTNNKTGKEEWVDSVTLARSNVATAEYAPGGEYADDKFVPIPRSKKGIVSYVPRNKIDYYAMRPDEMLSLAANTIPYVSGIKEMRGMLACLHPDTQLLVLRKDHIIYPLAGEYEHQPDDCMISVSHRQLLWRPVKGVYDIVHTGDLYQVEFMSGDQVIVTGDHKWPVYQKGKTAKILTMNLISGARIPRSIDVDIITPEDPGEYMFDAVYDVHPVEGTGHVINIDMDDHVYMLANGIFTHNSKHFVSTVPLDNPETPWVSTKDPDNDGRIESKIGDMLGTRRAAKNGVVTAVRKDRIEVKYDDGTKDSFELYDNYPNNQKGFINSTPLVKAGTKVSPGSILARTNFTDDNGTAANGVNLRTAFVSWNGLNYEDAKVISESAAKKLASTTMYKNSLDIDKSVKLGKANYLGWKPGEYSKDQLSNIGDDGIVKPGTKVSKGDPLFVGMRIVPPSPGSFGKRQFEDVSQTWEHDHPGIVTDVAHTRKGLKVFVKVSQPVQIGDKLSNSVGTKGVVACYDDQTEVLTERGWVKFEDLTQDDKVATLINDHAEFRPYKQYHKYEYDGELIGYKSSTIDLLVTPNHNLYWAPSDKDGKGLFKLSPADSLYGSEFDMLTSVDGFDILTVSNQGWYKQSYNGYVYCVTSDTGVIYVRRNDKPLWCGNSILPDEQMPKDEKGNPIDLLESPLSVISRTNSMILPITVLSEVAKKRGKPYYVDSFPKYDVNQFAIDEAKKHNVPITQTITDPSTGRKIPKTHVGTLFVYKQKHMSEGKESARGTESYSADDVPSRGGYYGCLTGDALIYTDNGKLTIEEIVKNKLNVKVMSYNRSKATWEYRQVTDWFEYTAPSSTVKHITLEDPFFQLNLTGNHYVYDNFGEKNPIDDFEIGDRVATYRTQVGRKHIIPSHPLKCVALYVTPYKDTKVYDITVDNNHNYVANGILVSNSKRLGNMETAAIVSHGAWDVLKDAKVIRGQANQDFWRSIRTGETPVMPSEPLVYQKFYNTLKAAGVNVKRSNTGVTVFSLTDKATKDLTGSRELNSSDTFDASKFTPIKGGLFGEDLFGQQGDQWAYIQLDEPLPNPVMEEPLRRILRLSEKEFNNVISGNATFNGETGGKAIQKALQSIDLKAEVDNAKKDFQRASKSKKDEALKRYVALKRIQDNGHTPDEYMLTRIPVLPAKYRPVTSSNGLTMVADTNYLYKQMLDARNDLREVQDLPDEVQGEARKNVYQAWKELTGIVAPSSPKLQQKSVKGLLRWALGNTPKTSALQQKLLTSTVDTVGRGVAVPDPTLKLDEVGIPKSVAFEMYKPFVTRALVNMNYTPLEAMKEVDKQSPVAMDVLQKVMEKRPVIYNRAPTLHKLSMVGLKPKITAGHVLRTNPSIVTGLGLDFDGNCLDFDSEILLKISKSTLDKYGGLMYIYSNLKQEEVTMKLDGMSQVVVKAAENQVIPCKIGEFPHDAEHFTVDKHGAQVYTVPEGIEVLTVDPITGKEQFSAVTGFSYERNCAVSEVTVLNKKVIVSENESLAVFDQTMGGLKKVSPLDENIKTYYVPVLKKDPRAFGSWGHFEIGWWIGAFLSDGWVSDGYVGYAKLEKSKRDLFIGIARNINNNFLAKEYAGSRSEHKLGESVKVHLFGKDLVEAVKQYKLYSPDMEHKMYDERASLYKELPEWLLNYATEDCLYGILTGLLDGDGSIAKNTSTKNPRFSCRFSTSSPYLRKSVEKLLYRLGIRCSTTVSPARNWSREAYTISPSTVDMFAILDKIKCLGERERELITEWKQNPPAHDRKDMIPITDTEWKVLRGHFGVKDLAAFAHRTNVGATTRASLLKLLDRMPEELQALKDRVNATNTLWGHVEEVVHQDGTREVFDLIVEDTKVFVANTGFVVYDTTNIHVPVMDSAVQDVYSKMLPQKNLISVRKGTINYPLEKEYRQGVYLASRAPKGDKPVKVFETKQEAMRAFNNNEIDIDTPIEIRQK